MFFREAALCKWGTLKVTPHQEQRVGDLACNNREMPPIKTKCAFTIYQQ